MGKVKSFFKTAAITITAGTLVVAIHDICEIIAANKRMSATIDEFSSDLDAARWKLIHARDEIDSLKNTAAFYERHFRNAERSICRDTKFIYDVLCEHREDLCKSIDSSTVDALINAACGHGPVE